MTDEELAAMKTRAAIDQAREQVKDIAGLTYGYFRSLVEAGFSAKEALALTGEWHRIFWAMQFENGKREKP
jgi:hypothetical protein